MPGLRKKIKLTVQRLKETLQTLTGRPKQWVLQPVRVKKLRGLILGMNQDIS